MNAYEGYHSFVNPEDDTEEYGSFEVWHTFHTEGPDGEELPEGWYWWACWPGCLPDGGEPVGPFETSQAAYEDAHG